jgi:iron complex outermembrane receptor protein
MSKPDLNPLARSIAMAFAAPLMLAMPVMAQQAAPAAASEGSAALEEVVVTARRTKEKLQDVPTAVTAISLKDLAELKIEGFESIAQTVPNVYIQKQGGSASTAQMQIRGISNGSLNQQIDSGIGLYVDGVYFGRPGAAAFDMADLERVEVLRGPQGTLFGRNATGGAINLITSGPTGQFGGNFEVGFGNFNQRRVKGTINTPEFNGLSARITLGHTESDGDVKNTAPKQTFTFTGPLGPYSTLTTNERGGDNKTDGGLIALSYKGVKDLKVDYKFDFSDWKGTLNYRKSADIVNGVPVGFDYTDSLYIPLEGVAKNNVRGHSLVVEYALSKQLTVKYIGGFRNYDLDVPGNQVFGDGGTTDLGNGSIGTSLFAKRAEKQRQSSHELQLIGTVGKVDWLAGLFTFEEKGNVNGPIIFGTNFGGVPIGPTNTIDPAAFNYFLGQDTDIKNKSDAAYAHATWHVDDKLAVSGGIRHTRDNRSEHIIAAGTLGATLGKPPVDSTFSGKHTDYDASITYKISPEASVYGKYATGYVSGGTLLGTKFDPEQMKAFEVGFKSELLERRLRLNVALFQQKRKDAQIEFFDGNTGGYLMGKSDTKASGLEIEANMKVTKDLSLNAAYGLTEARQSGDLRVTQPKHTLYIGADYKFQRWENGILPSVRVDANWRSDHYTMKCPAGTAQDPGKDTCSGAVNVALNEATKLKANTQLSARATLADIKLFGEATGRLSIWGRNLLNTHELEYNFSLGATTIANTFQRPRTFGVEFAMDF